MKRLQNAAIQREEVFKRYFEERKKAGSDIMLPNSKTKSANT
jgi:hypothetical protein